MVSLLNYFFCRLEYKIDEETKKKVRFYQPLLINEPSQINSNSIMNVKKENHEFIIYNEMSVTNEVYRLSCKIFIFLFLLTV